MRQREGSGNKRTGVIISYLFSFVSKLMCFISSGRSLNSNNFLMLSVFPGTKEIEIRESEAI